MSGRSITAGLVGFGAYAESGSRQVYAGGGVGRREAGAIGGSSPLPDRL